ncbi:hypothetical protein Ccrd_013479 [Cynara cardunculus var. scolymus]|uniref:Uncharacterized protein n=1 Tax=Cynara cardunculus var. scolymus TaxID=59895 RepID=A0A103YFI6_CYNCS|nr:hypothetical protein Ccrd_013479 [Cynara cardunculus var. scolymus]
MLSIPQVYRIGTTFWDDKYGTQGYPRSALDGKEIIQAKYHYTKAIVDGIAFDLNDDIIVLGF